MVPSVFQYIPEIVCTRVPLVFCQCWHWNFVAGHLGFDGRKRRGRVCVSACEASQKSFDVNERISEFPRREVVEVVEVIEDRICRRFRERRVSKSLGRDLS